MLMGIVLGLTGSFGSGKSTVAGMFAELGLPVIDADDLAREVVEPRGEALAEVVAEFGEGVLAPDGALDREKMAEIVFADPEARRRLNAIIHPRVGAALARFVQTHLLEPVTVLEIPLLLETSGSRTVDKVLVVTTSEKARLERLAANGYTESQVSARLASQMEQERKVELADFVIRNEGDLEETRRQVREVARRCGMKTLGTKTTL